MANIVEAVKNELTGALLEKLTASVGESVDTVKSAANAAAPALLSVLAGLALRPPGADKLISVLEGFSPDSAGKLRDDIIKGRGDQVQQRGGDILGSLLGGGLSTLIDGLAKFSGAKPESIRRLLGYMAPLVLGLVAGRLKSRGDLSAANLKTFFEEQKQHITGATPSELSLAGLPSPLHHSVAEAEAQAKREEKPYWLRPLLALGVVALIVWYFFLQQPPAPPIEADQTTTTTVPRGPQPIAPENAEKKSGATISAPAGPETPKKASDSPPPTASEVIKRLGNAHVIAITSLASVNSPETAEGQLPTLNALGAELDEIKGDWDRLSDSDKATVAKSSAENRDSFKSLVEKTLQKPEIAEKLKDALDDLVAKMDLFTA